MKPETIQNNATFALLVVVTLVFSPKGQHGKICEKLDGLMERIMINTYNVLNVGVNSLKWGDGLKCSGEEKQRSIVM